MLNHVLDPNFVLQQLANVTLKIFDIGLRPIRNQKNH